MESVRERACFAIAETPRNVRDRQVFVQQITFREFKLQVAKDTG
jgi:hypothetical protein